ncbi:hypothetical protein KSP40_PGU012997 [Platanthera guangdongensis]|uniref:Pentatricopeptide repeat-containing protein n=1 Tax=Platanthera guangdongensis TaxID=2320717 RepID=A0ABR2LMV4_9ASPA
MILSKLRCKSICSRRRLFYPLWEISASRSCSSSSGIFSHSNQQEEEEARLQITASMVCDTILRRLPRWETSILSLLPPNSGVFHSNCVGLVIRRLSESNPILSFRYFLWLSSSSSSSSLDPSSAAAFLTALTNARAWRAAMHAICSMKCLTEVYIFNSFVLHLCKDTRALHCDENLLHDLCDIIESNSTSLTLPSWNSALSASLRIKRPDIFRRLYAKMIESDTAPDAATAGYLIRVLCRDGEHANAYHVLRHVSRKGIIPDVVSITQLISFFAKGKSFGHVSGILHLMISGGSPPDLLTYQAIIDALCSAGATMVDEALRIFRELKLKGYSPDVVTYTAVIDGLCKSRRMDEAWLLWWEMISNGILPNSYTYNVIINGYFKTGDIDRALNLYDEMLSKGFPASTLSCNTMLSGLCINGRLAEAVKLFDKMPTRGIERDVITYNTLIQGLCEGGETSDAVELYSSLIAAGIEPSISTYTPLIFALCNEMRATDATELVRSMESRGLVPLVCTNDFVVVGFCRLGDADNGMAWLSKMLRSNLKPREETMCRLVECLSSLGRVDDALQVVNKMFDIGYGLGSAICRVLVSKLCGEDSPQRASRVMEEIMVLESYFDAVHS